MTTSQWQVADEPSDSGVEVTISAEARRRLRVEEDNALLREVQRVHRLRDSARLNEWLAGVLCIGIVIALVAGAIKELVE